MNFLDFIVTWILVIFYSNDNKNIAFQDPYNQTHSFVTDSVRLDIDINEVSGWPGQRFNLSLKALDELGNPTGSLIRFSFNPNNNKLVSEFTRHVHDCSDVSHGPSSL